MLYPNPIRPASILSAFIELGEIRAQYARFQGGPRIYGRFRLFPPFAAHVRMRESLCSPQLPGRWGERQISVPVIGAGIGI